MIVNKLEQAISTCEKDASLPLGDLTFMNKSVLAEFKKTAIPLTASEQAEQRQSRFDNELARRQMAFQEAMKIHVPPAPKFADEHLDEPIGEENIGIMLAEEIAKRQLVESQREETLVDPESANMVTAPRLSLESRVKALEDKVASLEAALISRTDEALQSKGSSPVPTHVSPAVAEMT